MRRSCLQPDHEDLFFESTILKRYGKRHGSKPARVRIVHTHLSDFPEFRKDFSGNMKILVLTNRYPPYYEGAYEYNCHQVSEGLIAKGHELVVLTTTFGLKKRRVTGNILRCLSTKNPDCQRRILRRALQIQDSIRCQRNYWVTRRLAEGLDPDLVFIWNLEDTSILPILAVQDLGLPTVFRVGSHWLIRIKEEFYEGSNRLKTWFRSGLLGFRRFEELKFNAAIIVGETLKQSYQRAGFDVENAIVIPSGIPEEWIANDTPMRYSSNRSLKLLYVGRLESAKGTEVAVRAVDELVNTRRYRNLSLDIIGKGHEEFIADLRQYIVSRNLQDIIKFIHFLPRLKLVQLYSDYDALVFPTPRLEGLPMTIIEAMAKGLVVAATDIGGPRDIVDNGRNGFLVPPNEPNKFADVIERIIQSPTLANQTAEAAIQTIRKKHSFRIMLNRYETYLKQSLGLTHSE